MDECRYWHLQAFLLWDRKSKGNHGSIPCKSKRFPTPMLGPHVRFISY